MPLFGQQREQLAKIRLERRQEGDDRLAQTVIENGPFALFGRSARARARSRLTSVDFKWDQSIERQMQATAKSHPTGYLLRRI